MSKRWTKDENELFARVLMRYRNDICDKEKKKVIEVTRRYAERLHQSYDLLHSRTNQAIYEHLTYFDDLTAGVGSPENYAIKDQLLFGKTPRFENNVTSNLARVIRSKDKYLT
jgi:hypothetical protein